MNFLDFLLKYRDFIDILSDLILIIFTFIIGFKGLDTIDKYHTKRQVDLEFQYKFDLKKQTSHQLREFTSIISETQSLFQVFYNKYYDFKGSFTNFELEILKDNFKQLENSYIKLDQIIFKSYLIDFDLIKQARVYRFVIFEFLQKYSKILEYLEENNLAPSEIDENKAYFKKFTIFDVDPSSVVFDEFRKIEEIISDTKS